MSDTLLQRLHAEEEQQQQQHLAAALWRVQQQLLLFLLLVACTHCHQQKLGLLRCSSLQGEWEQQEQQQGKET